MRKKIFWYITLNIPMWIFTFTIFAFDNVIRNKTVLHALVFVDIFLAILMMFYTIFITHSWTRSGLDKDWFKTHQELRDEIEKQHEAYLKASGFCEIIGRHEAIKMYDGTIVTGTRKYVAERLAAAEVYIEASRQPDHETYQAAYEKWNELKKQKPQMVYAGVRFD